MKDDSETPENWSEDELRAALQSVGLTKQELKGLKTKSGLLSRVKEIMKEDEGMEELRREPMKIALKKGGAIEQVLRESFPPAMKSNPVPLSQTTCVSFMEARR
jgi:hypothetical protein